MVGGADRSEKIRTYNFKENRISDLRLDGPLYRLEAMLAGDLDVVVEPLTMNHQARLLSGEAA
jgi:peptide chain release factor 1